MNPLIWKGSLGLLASTAIAGVVKLSVGISKISEEPQSIAKLLGKNRPDKRLLFEGHKAGSPEWRFSWKNYVGSFKGVTNNPLNVDTSVTGDDAPKPFMDACKNLFNEEVEGVGSDKYELALEYCTRDTLVRDLVWEAGKQALSEHSVYSKWNELWQKYVREENEWGLSITHQTVATSQFKKRCESEGAKKVSSRHDPLVAKVIRYCSKPQNEN